MTAQAATEELKEDGIVEEDVQTDELDIDSHAPESDGETEETSEKKPDDAADAPDTPAESATDEDDLLARAAAAGLTEEDVKKLGSAEATEAAIDAFDRKIAESGKTKQEDSAAAKGGDEERLIYIARGLGMSEEDAKVLGRTGQLERVIVDTLSKASGKTADSDKSADAGKAASKFELKLDEDMLDPDVVKTLKGMNDHYESRLAQLEAQRLKDQETIESLSSGLSAQQKRAQAVAQAEFEDRFDGMVEGLGAEFHDLLGTKKGPDLEKGSDHWNNRREILKQMDVLHAGYQKISPDNIPSEKALFDKSVRIVFADKTQAIARKKISSALSGRSKLFSSRPSARKGTESKTPEDRAKAAIAAKLREKGFDVKDPVPSEDGDGEI